MHLQVSHSQLKRLGDPGAFGRPSLERASEDIPRTCILQLTVSKVFTS